VKAPVKVVAVVAMASSGSLERLGNSLALGLLVSLIILNLSEKGNGDVSHSHSLHSMVLLQRRLTVTTTS
jgi:hypothetical protein